MTQDQKYSYHQNLVQVSRLGLEGDIASLQSLLRRLQRQLVKTDPEVAAQISEIISNTGSTRRLNKTNHRTSPPEDSDTRQQLLRMEHPIGDLPKLSLPDDVQKSLNQIVMERQKSSLLKKKEIEPTKSAVFFGPPGVGKTMTARWIAKQLALPLYTLDLSSVMSSLLGKTGANLKAALDFAKNKKAILLIDEFDAIAKSRADESDIGELKRLVTVLLQEVDQWPSDSLIIAATNHPELIDRAMWRRFDISISFPLPERDLIVNYLSNSLGNDVSSHWVEAYSRILKGKSIAEIKVLLNRAYRRAIVFDEPMENSLSEIFTELRDGISKSELKSIARLMRDAGISQREISTTTGLARDTIRNIE